MNNMKHYIFCFIALGAMSFAACSSEDDIIPGPDETDQWLHPYGASEADQALQTKFFRDNNIYLLFNDTLRKELVSVNPDGTPYYLTETVDLTYYLTGLSTADNQVFDYDYLTTDAEKQQATAFIQNQVLPHLSGELLPFSLLVVDQINLWSRNYAYEDLRKSNPTVHAGYRCTAVSVAGITEMNEAQQTAHRNNILKTIVNSKVSALPEDTFDEFYSYTSAYYEKYLMGDAAVAFFELNPVPMCIGLLDTGESYYRWTPTISPIMYNIKKKEFDLADYTSAVFTYSAAEFEAKYGEYPIVMTKYKTLRNIYEGIGVKF